MMHKKQHFVPRAYLEAWCDPATPTGQEPFVWLFPKEGGPGRRRAPKNVFHDTDLYTIRLPDGKRDLRLEHGLAGLESYFSEIARTIMPDHQEIDPEARVKICAFVAAMQARTPKHKAHMQDFWQGLVEDMEAMRAHMLALPPAKRAEMARSTLRPSRSGPSLGLEEVRKLAAAPLQHMLIPIIETQVPLLVTMNLAVLETTIEHGFITSDAPCVWFDPEANARPFPYNSPGLGWPTIEVTLPVSPRQLLLLNRAGLDGYYRVPEKIAHELNRRTRGYANQCFVGSHDRPNPCWYKMEPDPPQDSSDGDAN